MYLNILKYYSVAQFDMQDKNTYFCALTQIGIATSGLDSLCR